MVGTEGWSARSNSGMTAILPQGHPLKSQKRQKKRPDHLQKLEVYSVA
jgi:hypothetical protein